MISGVGDSEVIGGAEQLGDRRGPYCTRLTISCGCSMRTPIWNGFCAIGTPRRSSIS